MGTTNLGNQYITFRYRHPAKAQDFNTLLRGAIQPGVYEGGDITIIATNKIRIAPFTAYINVSNDKIIRVQTFLDIDITVNEETPIIYLKYEWYNVVNNYVDILQRANNSQPVENEVCLGKCIFDNGEIIGFDYSIRTYGKQLQIQVDENIPPLIVNSQVKINNLNSDLLDGWHLSDILNYVYPVGCFYTQYPSVASNDKNIAFPISDEPATLFGGTWTQVWNTDAVVFRTEGTPIESETSGRTNGLQTDQFQGHYVSMGYGSAGLSNGSYGIFVDDYSGTVNGWEHYGAYWRNLELVTNPIYGTLRCGAETRARNRLVKIWRRTA